MNKWDNDTEFEETTIIEVRDLGDTYDIKRKEGWNFFVDKKHGVEPKVGMKARFYGGGIGRTVRGLMLDDKMVFYKTPEELDEEHKKWVENTRKEYQEEHKKLMEKIKDEEPFETIDISGMGSGYERACQQMLKAGLEYLHDKPDFKFDFEEYERVYGVCWSTSDEAKKLSDVVTSATEGCSGAQHHVVINHLAYIYKHGYDKWLENNSDRKYTYPKELPKPSF